MILDFKGAPQRALAALLVLLSLLAASGPARADAGSRMDAYWSGALGKASATGPTAYQGQVANYYTMGNLSWRAPQKNLQVASVQLPAMSSGCGGIDIFSGGFSFINASALVAELKSIATSAVGYGFSLALQTLCPQCHKIMTELQDFAQKINATNIGSCQAASAMVDNLFNRTDASVHQMCSELGTGHGYFSDMVQGWAQCQASPAAGLGRAVGDGEREFVPVNKNIGWEAIRKVPYLSSDTNFSLLVMTLSGTVVERCAGDGAGGCSFQAIAPAADSAAALTALLDGGSFQGIACDDLDQCLSPTPLGTSFTIPQTSAFKGKVLALLLDIVSRVQARQPLTTDEQNFLQAAPVPLLKMAKNYVTYEGATLAQQDLGQYADAIATMVALYFVEETIQQVQAGAGNVQGADPGQMRQWAEGVRQVRAALDAKEAAVNLKLTASEQIIERARRIDEALAGSYASRLAGAYAFSTALGTR